MAMAPYVLVLARNSHQGATYAKRARLTRGRYRVVASASSIQGLRRAHVHILPDFDKRPDRHAILSVLRHAHCEFFTVDMPARLDSPPTDQGDGMGEQLTIEDAIESANLIEQHSDTLQAIEKMSDNEDVTTVAEAAIEHNVQMTEALEAHAERDTTLDPVGTLETIPDANGEDDVVHWLTPMGGMQHALDSPTGGANASQNQKDVTCETCRALFVQKAKRPRKPKTPPAGMFD